MSIFLKIKGKRLGNMAHVNVIKLSFYIYQMKAYSFSFEVVQTIFQKNEKSSSYDALNKKYA